MFQNNFQQQQQTNFERRDHARDQQESARLTAALVVDKDDVVQQRFTRRDLNGAALGSVVVGAVCQARHFDVAGRIILFFFAIIMIFNQ